MSVSGLCGVCESAPAVARCDRCGTLACRVHYDRERGLCADCVAATDPGGRDPNRDADRDVHRF